MRPGALVARNLQYYWRTNLAVVLGVAAAVAVLGGALLVGTSVRASLRDLVLRRLGKTGVVVTSAGFFREQLATSLGGRTCPLIILSAVVTADKTTRRAAGVQVYGVDERFWQFHQIPEPPAGAGISDALARELGVSAGDIVLVRVEKPSAVPKESIHGHKEDSGRTMRLAAAAVLSPDQLGEFSLRPQQGDVLAMFVPLRRLQRDLAEVGRVNTILAAGSTQPDLEQQLKAKVTLDDLGVRVRAIDDQNALSFENDSTILSDTLAAAAIAAAQSLELRPHPVFSYLANTIRDGGREIPYSVVTAIDPALLPDDPGEDGIYLNDWAAKELNAKRGDIISMDYYFWSEAGSLVTRTARFRLYSILAITGVAADRRLVPEYPGITEARTLADWDPPFPMDLGRVRPRDEDYWHKYRTTPKAFLALATGQRLWSSRFGRMTSLRLTPATDPSRYAARLQQSLDPARLGIAAYSPRDLGLAGSRGSTDFGEYFTYFSFFLVVSALLLTGLFFQLGVEQRLREIGTLGALGFDRTRIRRLFVAEGLLLAILGTALGTAGGVGYAALLLHGLRTWWSGAVGTSLLTLHISADALLYGALGGIVVACLCVVWTLRDLRKTSPRSLLAGTRAGVVAIAKEARIARAVAALSALAGLSLLGLAFTHRIDDTAGFFSAGTLLLIAALFHLSARLRAKKPSVLGVRKTGVRHLGFRNAAYRPGRSILSIALIASATFLLVALEAFRRPAPNPADRKSGTGGFAIMAESQLPIFYDPNTSAGRENLNLAPHAAGLGSVTFFSFRLRPGEDSSCLNLYEPRNPRILGARREFLQTARFSFSSARTITPAEQSNPWLLLEADLAGGAIPAVADANSITYVLHRKLGDEIVLNDGAGNPVRLRLVAALEDSIFQSELIISEQNFLRLFPEEQGFRVFLLDAPPGRAQALTGMLEGALSDFGFDAYSTPERLASYHRVENTYLSTFQALGGLGLLLGTLGLAAVLLRNVLERRRELALLRAIGYRPAQLGRMVLAENAYLLFCGLLIGAGCALLAIAPALAARGGQAPNYSAGWLLLLVPSTAMLASIAAVVAVVRAPLLATLRAE